MAGESTLASGALLQGAFIRGNRTFAFFPGLELWLEENVDVTPQVANPDRVANWRDQSNNGYNYAFPSGAVGTRSALIESDNINCKGATATNGNGGHPNLTKFDFLSGRFKRGVYIISKIKYNATDGDISWDIFRTGTQGGGQPDSCRIRVNSSLSRSLAYVVRNNGTNVNRTTAGGVFADDTYFLYRNILKTNNTANNHTQYVNNSIVLQNTENRSYPLGVTLENKVAFTVANATNTDKNLRLVLAYNWDSYSDAQIDAFDAGIIDVLRTHPKFSSLITW